MKRQTPPEHPRPTRNRAYLRALRHVWGILERRRRLQLGALLAVIGATALVETGVVGLLALFATAVADPQTVLESGYVTALGRFGVDAAGLTPRALVLDLAVLVLIGVAVKNAARGVLAYASSRLAAEVNGDIGGKLLYEILHAPYEWHLLRHPADLIKAVEWRTVIGDNLILDTLNIAIEVLVVAFVVAALLFLEPLIFGAIVVGLAAAGAIFFGSLRPMIDRLAERNRGLNVTVHRETSEALHAIKDVKILGQERPFMRGYEGGVRGLALNSGRLGVLANASTWLLEMCAFALLVGLIAVLLSSARAYTEVVGLIAVLVAATYRVLPGLSRVYWRAATMRSALPSVEYVLEHASSIAAARRDDDGARAEAMTVAVEDASAPAVRLDTSLELVDVSYGYPAAGRQALQGIDLRIERGESVGLIGPSGCGKTTLVDVIVALLSPRTGRLLVDGVAVDAGNRRAWMRNVGYVPQSPYLTAGSVAENVAFGESAERIDRERVFECCRIACAEDFVGRLEQGLDTPLGDRGVSLSGGERQRIAIARALYRAPRILVLDEATNALDRRTEAEIHERVRATDALRTVILVTHRVETLRGCDRVIRLQEGRIVRRGSPEEVLAEYEPPAEQRASGLAAGRTAG